MIILFHFATFHNLLLLHNSKFYSSISNFFECWKFWTHNPKAMAKDRKVNIAVTYCILDSGYKVDKNILLLALNFKNSFILASL